MGKGFLIASEAYVDVNASSYLAGCLLAELFTPLDGVATDTNMRKVGHELLLSESIDGKMSEKTETATAPGWDSGRFCLVRQWPRSIRASSLA